MADDNSFDLTDPTAQAFINIGKQRGASPAFIAASLGHGYTESNWAPDNADGDGGKSLGVMQWNRQGSPERVAGLMQVADQMGLPWTDPRVQATHWYNENAGNLNISDPAAANVAVLGSLRPQGWTSSAPQNSIAYGDRVANTNQIFSQLTNGFAPATTAPQPLGLLAQNAPTSDKSKDDPNDPNGLLSKMFAQAKQQPAPQQKAPAMGLLADLPEVGGGRGFQFQQRKVQLNPRRFG